MDKYVLEVSLFKLNKKIVRYIHVQFKLSITVSYWLLLELGTEPYKQIFLRKLFYFEQVFTIIFYIKH